MDRPSQRYPPTKRYPESSLARTKEDSHGPSSAPTEAIPPSQLERQLSRRDAPYAGYDHQSPDVKPFLHDILRLTPSNTEAKDAFSQLAQLQNSKPPRLHEDHSQYIQVTSCRARNDEDRATARPDDETTEEEGDSSPEQPNQQEVYEGYFRVGFDLPTVSKHLKWIAGRGSAKKSGPRRNVDILLAWPASESAKNMAATHFILSMHETSGVWLALPGADIHLEGKLFRQGEAACLYRRKMQLEIGKLQYYINFIELSSTEMEQEYIRYRNHKLTGEGMALPRTEISGIPSAYQIEFPSIIFRETIGSGTYATVFQGFFHEDGDLRVVKRLRCNSKAEVDIARPELEALQHFAGTEGIVTLFDWHNSRGHKSINYSDIPGDVYLIQEQGVAFNKYNWNASNAPDWSFRRIMCRQLLNGLSAIHQASWMHRDITPMNILLVDDPQSPRAVLCDFGRACASSTDTDTRLAAWIFLPPELEMGKFHQYNQKLDVWMLALALIYCWFPGTKNLRPREQSEYDHLCHLVMDHDKASGGLGGLLCCMLRRDPTKRPSAARCYQHPCIQSAVHDEPIATSVGSKRTYEK
ncbi:MAG: hypothetical protein Q9209_007910 [Squamulea sp. 1 TL-2023]